MRFEVVRGPIVGWDSLIQSRASGVHVSWDCPLVELSTVVRLEVLVLRVGLYLGLATHSASCVALSVPLLEGNRRNFVRCLQPPNTTEHLLMMYVPSFFTFFQNLDFLIRRYFELVCLLSTRA